MVVLPRMSWKFISRKMRASNKKHSLGFNPKFKLYKITNNLYCVEMKNPYDLAMLFVRYQEYYESPNPLVRGQAFDIDEYMRWYATSDTRRYVKGSENTFSYPTDFAGYNIPSSSINDILIKGNYKGNLNMWDNLMMDIRNSVILDIGKGEEHNFYLIGTPHMDSDVLRHEIAHGFYYLGIIYRDLMNDLIKTDLTKVQLKEFKKVLKTYHYADEVMLDEIQAYLSADEQNREFPKVNDSGFKTVFKEYYKNIKPKLI